MEITEAFEQEQSAQKAKKCRKKKLVIQGLHMVTGTLTVSSSYHLFKGVALERVCSRQRGLI